MADKYFITGDIVGADAPNYGEKRVEIGGALPLIVDTEISVSAITLKEKAKVIYDTFANGGVVRAKMLIENGIDICGCVYATNNGGYRYTLFSGTDLMPFEASTDDDFPTMDISG